MNFLQHFNLKGKHAVLGASKYHWINYDQSKMAQVYRNQLAAAMGTRLHAAAAECIALRLKLEDTDSAINRFVNDSIDYKMTPEQVLYFSDNCFGTADAISFNSHTKTLRIFDLKTGQVKGHMEQLLIYAALFCLEYKYDPNKIRIELRIYQYDGCDIFEPTIEDILPIMDKIVAFDEIITDIKEQEGFMNV